MKRAFLIGLTAVALVGCRERAQPVEQDNAAENVAADAMGAPPPVVTPPPAPPANETNASAEATNPAPTVSEQVQMQEDADATGMTARTRREPDAGEPETAPAEQDK